MKVVFLRLTLFSSIYRKTTEWMRTVTRPMQQLAPVSRSRGFVDEYGSIDAEVLLIDGQTHEGRKAVGFLHFTNHCEAADRDDSARSHLNGSI
jgi:hypothetical protein